ncbi:hypothetical protein NPIL_479241 [Nephila pilipes]|uniref:Uncharacterized protein n=1 Tax=Nephila pilipes TaxID=299642 RepID=A0A8X6UCT8_NEPPI|nr:hypothetical protein NPIL_479241 [Nephila pilipes]
MLRLFVSPRNESRQTAADTPCTFELRCFHRDIFSDDRRDIREVYGAHHLMFGIPVPQRGGALGGKEAKSKVEFLAP